ncbi:hypothetical protein RSOL_033840, partial [Rhizoctonia solani AG-3 Rhs1AP]
MTKHTRKRARVPAQSDDNISITTAQSNSSGEFTVKTDPSTEFYEEFKSLHDRYIKLATRLLNDDDLGDAPPDILPRLGQLIHFCSLAVEFPFELLQLGNDLQPMHLIPFQTAYNNLHPKVDASTSTEPQVTPPTLPEMSYASVASQASAPSTPSKPPRSRKEACRLKPPAKTPNSPHSRHAKVGQQIRLVACISSHSTPFTSANPRWKAVPTDCFSTFSKELQAAAPGCVPLGFRTNRKGNLLITFAPSTPRSVLMSRLPIIRGSFELASNVL